MTEKVQYMYIVREEGNAGNQHCLPSTLCFYRTFIPSVVMNPLPDLSFLDSSNSSANKDMMSKMWTNGDTII